MTRFALEKDRITALLLALVALAGVSAFFSLPQDEDPGFTMRIALVQTLFPGASPARVESLVTDKIEEKIQEIAELDHIKSESRAGLSLVFVNIEQSYDDMDPIWEDLRRKMDEVAKDLPDGVIGPIVNDDFGDTFGILIAITAEGFDDAELKDVADEVRDELLLLEDVSKVETYGSQEERIFIEYSDARLAEVGLSANQLAGILNAQNVVIPGGSVVVGRERVLLEPTGNFESLDELRRSVIALPNSSEVVFLEDIADVRRAYIDPPQQITRVNGEPCVVLGISMRKGGSIIFLGEQVDELMARLQATYPIGVDFRRVANQPQRVEEKVDDFVVNLLQAVGLVLVVMLVTLGLRTGFLVASLIPMTMLFTLAILQTLGGQLDQMSLAALIIALGMLIDNAIVMSESVVVQAQSGKSLKQAAIDSAAELRVPLLISSLTTAAAFLPFRLAENSAGEYTGVLFTVVAIALLCSWLLSLTMTPLLCTKLMKVPAAVEESYGSRFYKAYRGALLFVLRQRAVSLVAVLVLFFVALQGMSFLPNLFFPKSDRTFLMAALDLPTGSDIAATDAMVKSFEEYVSETHLVDPADEDASGVVNFVSFVGGGEPRFILNANTKQQNPAYAFVLLNLTDYESVEGVMEDLKAFCAREFPDVLASITMSDMGPPVEKPIQVRISGRDADQVFAYVDQVKAKLREIPGSRDITDNWGARIKKLLVDVDQPRARRAGVSSQDVAVSLQTLLEGLATTEFREERDTIPIVLRSVAADRQDIAKLESYNVYSQSSGGSVPLMQVADVRVEWESSRIFRRDRLKTVTVEAAVREGLTASDVGAPLYAWLEEASKDWRAGYKYEQGGEVESSGEAQKAISDQLPLAGGIIVLLLIGQFNSFRRGAIVLLTIPLGMIGVVAGLLLLRSYFGFMTLLGIVSLAGIIINNAIVLIDRIGIEINENGRAPQEAIVEAAQRRLRPILMTTATTIFGLVPLYLSGGPMWEPMAIAIMFGLAFATVLTLGLVPVLYSLFFGVSFKDYTHEL